MVGEEMAEKMRSTNLNMDLKRYEPNKKNFDTSLGFDTLINRKINEQIEEKIELNVDEETKEYYKIRKERIEEIDGEISSYNELLNDIDSSLQKKSLKELLDMTEQLKLKYPIVKIGATIVNSEAVSVVDNEEIIDTSKLNISNDGKITTNNGKELTEEQILQIKEELSKGIKKEQQEIINNAIIKLEEIKKDIPYELLKMKKDYNDYIKEFNAEEMHKKMENLTGEYRDAKGNIVYDDYVSYSEYLDKNGKISPIEFLQAHYMLYNPDTKYKTEKLNKSNYGLKGEGLENFKDISLDEIITLSYELLYIKDINEEYEQIYNYLYYTSGVEKANEYLSLKKEEIHKLVGEKRAEEFLKGLSETNDVETYMKTTGKGFMDGIDSFCEGIESWVNSSDVKSAEEYEKMYILMALQSQENKKKQGLIDEEGNSNSEIIDYSKDYAKGSEYVYKYSQAIGNMAPSIALSMINPTIGTTSLGISAGGQNYHEALVEGYGNIQAITYGALTGVTAATMERMLGTIPGLGKKEASSLIGKMLSEGSEEALEQLVQSGVWDRMILGKEINIEEMSVEIIQSAIDGAIVSGILNTPGSTINIVNKGLNIAINLEQAKQIKESLKNGVGIDIAINEVTGKANEQTITNESSKLKIREQIKESATKQFNELKNHVTQSDSVVSQIDTAGFSDSNGHNNTGWGEVTLDHADSLFSYLNSENKGNYGVNQGALDSLYFYEDSQGNRYNNSEISDKLKKIDINTRKQISSVIDTMNQKYGNGITSLINYLQTDDLSYITRENNSRLIIKNIPKENIQNYIDEIYRGLDPSLNVTKIGTDEYMRLKNKLMSKGFSAPDASLILSGVDKKGACSYAAALNEVVNQFLNHNDLFKQYFGYDLFIEDKNGSIRINSGELLLDLYLFANDVDNLGQLWYKNPNTGKMEVINKDFNQIDVFNRPTLNSASQNYMSNSLSENIYILNSFLKSKNKNLKWNNERIYTKLNETKLADMEMNEIIDVVQKNLIDRRDIHLGIYSGTNENPIKFISMNNPSYVISTNSWREGGGHAVYVTGMTNMGFIVSSWGEKFLIPFSDLQNGNFVVDADYISGIGGK